MKIKNTLVEYAPIYNIEIISSGNVVSWAHIHWSKNRGMDGYQVCMRYSVNGAYNEYKTKGGGFCKESEAFGTFVMAVLNEYQHVGGMPSYYCCGKFSKYSKGGNFYQIPKTKLKSLFKR